VQNKYFLSKLCYTIGLMNQKYPLLAYLDCFLRFFRENVLLYFDVIDEVNNDRLKLIWALKVDYLIVALQLL